MQARQYNISAGDHSAPQELLQALLEDEISDTALRKRSAVFGNRLVSFADADATVYITAAGAHGPHATILP